MVSFEAMSGIKINLDKTYMYHINIILDQVSEIASVFRCHLSKFPFNYWAVPLHDKKLRKGDWRFLIDKFEKKLPSCMKTPFALKDFSQN